jgi:hypothetical protein
MKDSSIKLAAQRVLSEITAKTMSRERRLTTLLRDPVELFTEDWFMCVPQAFNDALDIRLTERIIAKTKKLVWTQGSVFSFSRGDTLYDTKKAYEEWSTALQHINIRIQVERAMPSNVYDDGKRFSGTVTLEVSTPNSCRTNFQKRGSITMTQDDFVEFLIFGPKAKLLDVINQGSENEILEK